MRRDTELPGHGQILPQYCYCRFSAKRQIIARRA